VICALPVEIIERVSNMRGGPTDDEAENEAGEEVEPEDAPVLERQIENFRGALKAATLALRIPIQIVWPTTYDNDAVVKKKLAEFSTRKVQDEATRAWNFFCALYYKAGGTPWRMIRDQREFSANSWAELVCSDEPSSPSKKLTPMKVCRFAVDLNSVSCAGGWVSSTCTMPVSTAKPRQGGSLSKNPLPPISG
jgi:hypothetical protein